MLTLAACRRSRLLALPQQHVLVCTTQRLTSSRSLLTTTSIRSRRGIPRTDTISAGLIVRRFLFNRSGHQQQQQALPGTKPVVASTTASGTTNSRWVRIARIIRFVRIPVLVISVYSLGYQQGVIDCTKEPVQLQRQILQGILMSTGCRDLQDFEIVRETDVKWHSRARSHQVAAVGQKIVQSARNLVETELQTAMEAVRRQLPADVTRQQEVAAMLNNDEVVFWDQARLRLEGENVEHQPWEFVFIQSTAPNAFVTEILPRRFFITTAMLQLATTPDELAVVLGHEVSHLILGHVSATNRVEAVLQTVEVLLLSMDPTAGLLSVAFMGLLYGARKMLSAAHSRDNEVAADNLGLKIAATACYDTVNGCKVMYKMHQASVGASSSGRDVVQQQPDDDEPIHLPAPVGNPALVRLMDTHPPSLDRYDRMKQAAESGENYTAYPDCAGISSRFFNALWGSSSQ